MAKGLGRAQMIPDVPRTRVWVTEVAPESNRPDLLTKKFTVLPFMTSSAYVKTFGGPFLLKSAHNGARVAGPGQGRRSAIGQAGAGQQFFQGSRRTDGGRSAHRLLGGETSRLLHAIQLPFFALIRYISYAAIKRQPKSRVAEALGIGQDGASRLEQRYDFLNSTLRSYIEAMGGGNFHSSRVFRIVSR